MLHRAKLLTFILLFSFLSQHVQAYSYIAARKIKAIGCHNTDSICFIDIEGEPVGPLNCRSTSIRWDSNTLAGKNQFTLLLSAYHANKALNIAISNDCFTMQPNFPTILFTNI